MACDLYEVPQGLMGVGSVRLLRLVLLVSVFSGLLGVFTPEAKAELWEIDGARFPGLYSDGRNLFYNQSGYYRPLFIKSDGQLVFSDGVEATAAIPSALSYYRAKPISHPGVNAFLARTAPPTGPSLIPIPPPFDPSGYRLVSHDPAFSKLYTDGRGMFFKDGDKYRAVTFDRRTKKILFDGKDEASAEAVDQIIGIYRRHSNTDTTVIAMLEAYKDKLPPKPDPAKAPKLTLTGTTHAKGSDVKLDFTQENIPSGTVLKCTMTFPKLLRADKPFVLSRNINVSDGKFGLPERELLKSVGFLDTELTGTHDYSLECMAKVGDQVVTAKKDGLVLDTSLLPGKVEPPKPKEFAIRGADIVGNELILNIEHPGFKPDTKLTCTLVFPGIKRTPPQTIEFENVGLDGKIQLPPWRNLNAVWAFERENTRITHDMTVQCQTPDNKKTNVQGGLKFNPKTLAGYVPSGPESSLVIKNPTLDPKNGKLGFEMTHARLPSGLTEVDCTYTFTDVRNKSGGLATWKTKVPVGGNSAAMPSRKKLKELGFEGDKLDKPAAFTFVCNAGSDVQSPPQALILDPKALPEDGPSEPKKETLTIKAKKSDATHVEVEVTPEGFTIGDEGIQCTLDLPTAGVGGKALQIKLSGDKNGKLVMPDKGMLVTLGFDPATIKGKHAYSMECTAKAGKFTSNKLTGQTLDLSSLGGPDAPKTGFKITGTELKDGKIAVEHDLPAEVKKLDCVMTFPNVKKPSGPDLTPAPIQVKFTMGRDGTIDLPWMKLKAEGFGDSELKSQPTSVECSATVKGAKVTSNKQDLTFDPTKLAGYDKRPTMKMKTAVQNPDGTLALTHDAANIPVGAKYRCQLSFPDNAGKKMRPVAYTPGTAIKLPDFSEIMAKLPKDQRHEKLKTDLTCFYEFTPEGATEPIEFASEPVRFELDPKKLKSYDSGDAPPEKPDPKAKKCAVVAIGKEHLANEANSATFTMAVDAALLVRGLAAKGYEVTVLKPETPSSYIDLTGGKVKKTLEGWNEDKLLKEVKDMGTRGCTVADVHINSHGCATSTGRYTVDCGDRCDTDPRKPSFLRGGDNGKDVCWGCATGKKGDMLMNSDALIDALADLQKGPKKPKTLLAADSCHAGRVFSNKWREHMKDEDFKNNVCVIAAGNGGVVALNNPNANISRIHRNFFFNCADGADRTAIKDELKKMPDDLLAANKESLKKEITARLEKLEEFKDRDTKDEVKTAFEKKLEAEIERVLKDENDGRVGRVDRVCDKLGPSKPGTTILDAFLDGVRTDRTNSAQISSFYGTKAEKYFFSDRTMSTYVALNDLHHYRNDHFDAEKAGKELTRLHDLKEKGYPTDLLDASFLPALEKDSRLRGEITKAWREYTKELEKLKALFEAAKGIKTDTKDKAEIDTRNEYFNAVEALREKFATLKKMIDGAVPATDEGKSDLKKTLGIKPTDACESRKLD